MIGSDDVIEVPSVGDRKSRSLSRQIIGEILEPRVEEIFSMLYADLERSGYSNFINAGVILTGGSSELEGITEMAEQIFDVPARIGYPGNILGLVDVVNKPMYATAVGLVLYGAKMREGSNKFRIRDNNIFSRVFGSMKHWFREII